MVISLNDGNNAMFTHRVFWEVKDNKGQVITKYKDFDDVPSACSFVREIKGSSISKPIMDEIIKTTKGKK